MINIINKKALVSIGTHIDGIYYSVDLNIAQSVINDILNQEYSQQYIMYRSFPLFILNNNLYVKSECIGVRDYMLGTVANIAQDHIYISYPHTLDYKYVTLAIKDTSSLEHMIV